MDAKRSYEDAFALTDLWGYRLNSADALFGLAQAEHDLGEEPAARAHARESAALAQCDKVPHRYELGIVRAEALLNNIE